MKKKAPSGGDDQHGDDGANPPSRNSQERAFNRWLNEQLRKKYDPVLDESIPDEILELLRRDRGTQ